MNNVIRIQEKKKKRKNRPIIKHALNVAKLKSTIKFRVFLVLEGSKSLLCFKYKENGHTINQNRKNGSVHFVFIKVT